MLVPLSEAKARLHELANAAADEEVVLLRHGRPVAVLVGHDAYQQLLDEIEDLRDQLSVVESERAPSDMRVPLAKARAELGL